MSCPDCKDNGGNNQPRGKEYGDILPEAEVRRVEGKEQYDKH